MIWITILTTMHLVLIYLPSQQQKSVDTSHKNIMLWIKKCKLTAKETQNFTTLTSIRQILSKQASYCLWIAIEHIHMNKFAEVTINTYNKMIPILASKHTNGSFQVGLSFDFVKKPKFIWSLSIPLKIYRIIGCYFFMIKMLLIISSNYNKFAENDDKLFCVRRTFSNTKRKGNKGKKKMK